MYLRQNCIRGFCPAIAEFHTIELDTPNILATCVAVNPKSNLLRAYMVPNDV